MKKILLISALLFSFNGWADNINGTMRCTIKDQIILEMKDGVDKRFSRVENGYKIGDIVTFGYFLPENRSFLRINLGELGEVNIFSNTYYTTTTKKLESKRNNSVVIPERLIMYSNDKKAAKILFTNDEIDADMGTIQRLILTRYYKNDWNGIFTFTTPSSIYSGSIDCRQGINQYDELLETLYDLADENE
jgi:hypothetical protein